MLSKLRDPVSCLTHLFGAVAALIGLAALLALGGDRFPGNLALVVYGLSLFALFTASSTYHSFQGSPRVTRVLRKVDHSAIYLLIAGTYTPFCVIAFEGFWRWGFLSIIWGLALVGIVSKMFGIRDSRWVTAGVYVLMGWLCLFAIRQVLALPAQTVGWLAAGGLIYTAGAGVYITKRMNFFPGVFGFHEVWHIFVLLGAAAHYVAVVSLVTMG